MLVERFTVNAVREALHHERAVLDDGEDVGRHPKIEAEQLALGDARVGPEDLVQIADRYSAPVGEHESAASFGLFQLLQQLE